jgi:gliding motility-associated protein GldM
MAGLKETPRQKMIGMMYLVLTAILALQVSSSLLDKFTLLNNSLVSANSSANEKNLKGLAAIKEAVNKSSNPSLYTDVVKSADEVRRLATEAIAEVDKLKEEVVTAGGGYDEAGNILNPTEEEKVAILMVGQGNGKAYDLKAKLNSFAINLAKLGDAGTVLQPLALDGKEDPISSKSPEQASKDFATLNFAQTPVPAALAVLSQKQSEIRRYENSILDQLAAKVGAKEIKFDKIFGMISAKSNTVVAGTPFEAEMFIAASSSAITPRMSFNGASMPVSDGKAKIKFIAQGGQYDAKAYTGSISFNDPSGQAKTITVEGEYFVAKPTYNVLAGSLPGLYLGCQNKLEVISPGLGSLWQPNFSADGGDAIAGGGGKVTLVPSSASITLNINNQGQLLGKETYRVQKVPRPDIVITGNGAAIDERKGMPATQLRSLNISCIPGDGFKASCPEDARFRATLITVTLARGTKKVDAVSFEKEGSISRLASQAQPGDRYVVDIEGIKRQNFRNEILDMGMGRLTRNIPLY